MSKQVIWKYGIDLTVGNRQALQVPKTSIPIMVAAQNSNPCIWFRCDPLQEKTTIFIKVVGTGHFEIDPTDSYIGSAICGLFVWHVFAEMIS